MNRPVWKHPDQTAIIGHAQNQDTGLDPGFLKETINYTFQWGGLGKSRQSQGTAATCPDAGGEGGGSESVTLRQHSFDLGERFVCYIRIDVMEV